MATEPTPPLARRLLEDFLRHLRVERGLSPRTGQTYSMHLGGYLDYLAFRGRNPLVSDRSDILAYLEHRQKQGVRPSTLFGVAIAIRQFHRFLVSECRAPADPTTGMKLPKLKPRLPEPLTEDETDKLFSFPAIKFIDVRDRAILELLYSGLRISEALAVRLEDIQTEEGYVQVVFGKGGRKRLVPVGAKGIEALGLYMKARIARFSTQLPSFFVSYRGKPLTRTGFWLRLKTLARRAGIRKRLYPHLLRHGFATDMLTRGCDLKALQEMLGHANLATTSIYLHPTTKHLIQAHRRAHPRA